MFCAFTPQAAHQFFEDRHYPKSYSYRVREKYLAPVETEEEQLIFESVLDYDGGLG